MSFVDMGVPLIIPHLFTFSHMGSSEEELGTSAAFFFSWHDMGCTV
jgi:hypothetical protein